jgi:rod shape-determining protein MreC
MQGWREAALQLEQKNAQLLALNNVRLNPRLTFVTGEVMADAGSPFRRSAMVNVGRIDGVTDGSAAMDGLGLVGRIAGVGERSSRIIFLTDGSSRVPALIRPSGQRAMVAGDNGLAPVLEFVEQTDELRPGDRVVSSGDGGLYPPDILIGQVIVAPDGRQRVRLAADYRRLDFVRVVRAVPQPQVEGPGGLIGPLMSAAPAPAAEAVE